MLETGFLKEDSHDTGSLAWGFVMKDCIGALQTFLHRVFQLVGCTWAPAQPLCREAILEHIADIRRRIVLGQG